MEMAGNWARSKLALMYLSQNDIKNAKEQLNKFPRRGYYEEEPKKLIAEKEAKANEYKNKDDKKDEKVMRK